MQVGTGLYPSEPFTCTIQPLQNTHVVIWVAGKIMTMECSQKNCSLVFKKKKNVLFVCYSTIPTKPIFSIFYQVFLEWHKFETVEIVTPASYNKVLKTRILFQNGQISFHFFLNKTWPNQTLKFQKNLKRKGTRIIVNIIIKWKTMGNNGNMNERTDVPSFALLAKAQRWTRSASLSLFFVLPRWISCGLPRCSLFSATPRR